MLLRRAVLDRISAGEIDVVVRRWRRPTDRAGGTLRTAIGMLEIVAVEAVALDELTDDDARRAGYDHLDDLLGELDRRTEGTIYRITVRPGGTDPRVALREDTDLPTEELDALVGRLDRLDRASSRGPWTRTVLRLLAEHPHEPARDLAARLSVERDRLKVDVRKLKALGLTISHSPGYELSPRGRVVLRHLDATP